MPYDENLAERVRKALAHRTDVEEKQMFSGLAFLVDGKMCVNVSGMELMCRFDPAQQSLIEAKPGFRAMIMKGKKYKGYCYVSQDHLGSNQKLAFWLNLALEFNPVARKSGSKKTVKKKSVRRGSSR